MTNPDTPSEYITTAVPTVVGGVLKLCTMPLIETGMAATLNDINIWPIAITIIGSQESSCTFVTVSLIVLALMSCFPFRLCSLISGRRLGNKEIHAQLLRKIPGDQLSPNAVAGVIEQRRECSQSTLSR